MNEIYLSSSNYTSITNNRYLFEVPNGITLSQFRIKDVSLQNSFYQVEDDSIGFTIICGPTTTVYIPGGIYTTATLLTALNALVYPAVATVLWSYSSSTGKFTLAITLNSGVNSISITPINSNTAKMLGMDGSTILVAILTTPYTFLQPYVVNLLLSPTIYLRCSNFSNKASLNKSQKSNILANIHIGNATSFECIRYTNTSDMFFIEPQFLSSELELYFTFQDDTPININGGFFNITMLTQ